MDERRKAQLRANKQNSIQRAREFVDSYLATQECVNCQERDTKILTFDHVRGEKRANIADMVRNGLSVATIAEEISKTEVVCFNCHSLGTQQRLGSYRYRLGKLGMNK